MALSEPGELTPMQEKAIVALLSEASVAAAARAAGCSVRALHDWLQCNERFRTQYRRHRREAFSHAIALAQQMAPMAMATLAKIAANESAPYQARVTAAVAMLRFGRESLELDDLAERVERLEGRVIVDAEKAEGAA